MGYAMTHSCSCAYDNVAPTGVLLSGSQTTCAATGTGIGPCPVNNPSTSYTTLRRPYLPCPDTDGSGVENRPVTPGACSQTRGYFPWRDLGTASQDAWGNRILYAVTPDMADSTKGFQSSSAPVATPTATWNQLLSSTVKCNPMTVDVAINVPVVLISHGPNSRGARNVNIPLGSATPAPPSATDANELQNLGTLQSSCTASSFINNTPSASFDDLVAWLPFGALISRVCQTPGGCL